MTVLQWNALSSVAIESMPHKKATSTSVRPCGYELNNVRTSTRSRLPLNGRIITNMHVHSAVLDPRYANLVAQNQSPLLWILEFKGKAGKLP